MYADVQTPYTVKAIIGIGYSEIANSIALINLSDELNIAGAKTYYKTTSLNKAELIKILGTLGNITISDFDTEIEKANITIGESNTFVITNAPDTTITEDTNNIIITYPENTSNLLIVTSDPISEGQINISHEKYMITNDCTIEQIASINKATATSILFVNEITEESSITTEKTINILEPTTDIDLEISNNEISSAVENNVVFTTILKTDSYSNKLFENPVIEIELPEEIISATINSVNLLHETELTILSQEVITNIEGHKVLKVTLSGIQTLYSIGAIQGGANLVIDTQIETTKAIANKSVEVIATCVNDGENATSNTSYLDITSQYGLINLNTINVDGKTTNSISQETTNATLDIFEGQKTANIDIKLINNYESEISNLEIIGRIPYIGANAETQELINTFNANLISGLDLNGMDAEVYYSPSANATLEDASWTQTVNDFSLIKSFKIVLNGTLSVGTVTDISYDLAIPSDLEYNQDAYTSMQINYSCNEQNLNKKSIMKLTTGQGPELDIQITPQVQNALVHEGQIVTYTIELTNSGDEVQNDITLEYIIPEGNISTEYTTVDEVQRYIDYQDREKLEWEIETLNPGEKVAKTFDIKMGDIIEETSQINNVVNAKMVLSGETEKTIVRTEEFLQEIEKAKLNVYMDYMTNNEIILNRNSEIKYAIKIENNTNETINNVVLEDYLPENTEYNKCYLISNLGNFDEEGTLASFNSNTGLINLPVGDLEAQDSKFVIIILNVLDEELNEANIQNTVSVYADNISKHESNIIKNKVTTSILNITQTAEHPTTIKEGDNVKYIIKVSNTGKRGELVSIKDLVPEQIATNKLTYYISEENKNTTNVYISDISVLEVIEMGETLTVEIEGQVKNLPEGITETTITNTARIDGYSNKEATVVNTIQKNIIPQEIKVTGITLNKSETTRTVGEQEILTAVITPTTATNKNIIWASARPEIITVDSNGNLNALSAGISIITATTEDGGFVDECTVTVLASIIPDPDPEIIHVTGVNLNASTVTLEQNEQRQLTANILPTTATNKNITWISNNTSIATVSNTGLITGIAYGTTQITVLTEDGGFVDSCTINVNKAEEPIEATYEINGTAWLDTDKDGRREERRSYFKRNRSKPC